MTEVAKKKLAKKMAASEAAKLTGFDPATLLLIFQTIIGVVQKCKPDAFTAKDKMSTALQGEIERCRKAAGDCCPARVRMALMRQHQIKGKVDQDRLYFAAVSGASSDSNLLGIF